MKNLITTIAWLEYARVKSRVWLLLSLLVAFSFALSTCGRANMHVDVGQETAPPIVQQDQQDRNAHSQGPSFHELKQSGPFAFFTFITMILGAIVLLTVPFRGRQEWESGMFQMVVMGDYRMHEVEVARVTSYLMLAAAFFLLVILCSSAYVWKYDLLPGDFILKIYFINAYLFVALIPVMLAFGVMVSAVNTAYYQHGSGRTLSFVKYLSCGVFFICLMKSFHWFLKSEFNLLPAMPMQFDIPGGALVPLTLKWEFPLLTLLLAAFFVFWSGRILEEVEA